MLIKIDCREKDLITACKNRIEYDKTGMFSEIQVASDQLSLGDAAICDTNGNICVLIERKTLKDLASSITDGRYAEQGFRLAECEVPNHNIIYLIEGSLQNYIPKPGRIPRSTLVSSMISINHIKGFSLYKTNSVVESAEWLLHFAKKLSKTTSSCPVGGNETTHLKQNYVMVAKRAKKNSITKDNIGQIMLAQIPGVSSSIADVIIKTHGSLYLVLKKLQDDPNALCDLTIQTATGKTRKISKTAIQNIKQYLISDMSDK
tara:strand:+ start:484 stop:1266 length:783 start_codon:yes stop_codon:yes gene_type:complete